MKHVEDTNINSNRQQQLEKKIVQLIKSIF